MIKRYSDSRIEKIWTDQNKFEAYLKVEIASSKAWNLKGIIPNEDLDKIIKKASFDLNRIYEIEKETKHDVIAFTRAVSETLGEEKKWIHYGLTSTDVVDSAYGILIKKANSIISSEVLNFLDILKQKAFKYKDVPTIGRTHGIHADITSFGLKFALWYDELVRVYKHFQIASREIEVGKISGAVGNFANTSPEIQDLTCKFLNLKSAPISTQVLSRDRHANYIFSIAQLASLLEKIALEVRSLQRTEINEVQEYFDKNQKGSSAMPHKKNPISSENITGIARIIRSYVQPSLENNLLWHERDISHSSAERIIIPDITNLICYAFVRYSKVIDNLIFHPKNMLNNIYKTNGVIFSQQILNYLIKEKGLSREKAYDLIQPIALDCFENNKNFKDELQNNLEIKLLIDSNTLEELFNLDKFLKYTNQIFERVFK